MGNRVSAKEDGFHTFGALVLADVSLNCTHPNLFEFIQLNFCMVFNGQSNDDCFVQFCQFDILSIYACPEASPNVEATLELDNS